MRLQVYTQQINKISDFKLTSDSLNIVFPIYIYVFFDSNVQKGLGEG